MPWYGMHLIERVRNQAIETERHQSTPNQGSFHPPSRTSELLDALPTLFVVTVWGMASALMQSVAADSGRFDTVLVIACVPVVMALVGVAWGQHKSWFTSGLDAAIITGTVMGFVFLLSLLLG